MTLMTNDLNDHFLGGRGGGGGREGETQNRRHFTLLPTGPTGSAMESQGTGDRREKRERRERKLELKNLGTSAGYGYLPVAQARYRELQRARQGIYHLQPGFARLGVLYHTGTHIFLQRFRQTEHG